MTLRGEPVEERAVLPSGGHVTVTVGIADDPYVREEELDTVALVLRSGEDVLAAVNTVLDAEHVQEAQALAREVATALASGEVEPTAGALERYADRMPDVR